MIITIEMGCCFIDPNDIKNHFARKYGYLQDDDFGKDLDKVFAAGIYNGNVMFLFLLALIWIVLCLVCALKPTLWYLVAWLLGIIAGVIMWQIRLHIPKFDDL